MFNALTFDIETAKRAGGDLRVFYAGETDPHIPGAEFFRIVPDGFSGDLEGNVYLPSLLVSDATTDAVMDHVLSGRGKLIVSACRTLEEVGTCDKRYGVTPVGLAHKYGLLDGAFVAGGTYLDKDDIDLINQSSAEIIVTPSMSMGLGEGIPPLRMMLTFGASVHIGTGLRDFNPEGDLSFEARLLSLSVSGALCTPGAIPEKEIEKMLK